MIQPTPLSNFVHSRAHPPTLVHARLLDIRWTPDRDSLTKSLKSLALPRGIEPLFHRSRRRTPRTVATSNVLIIRRLPYHDTVTAFGWLRSLAFAAFGVAIASLAAGSAGARNARSGEAASVVIFDLDRLRLSTGNS